MKTNVRLQLLAVTTIILLHLCPYSNAHFFPNISSIPPGIFPNSTANPWAAFQKLAGCRSGEKLDGLTKLKEYFRHFGYIPGSAANLTDYFDDELSSALKTYQQNFNLNVTGELDEQTINQIVRPRCGIADIVNGSSTMNSGKTPPFNASRFHSVAHYNFFPGRPRWPAGQTDLTYVFLPNNKLTDEVKSVFTRAFDRWSTVIPLNFTQTDSYSAADIRIAFYAGDHGDGEPFDGVLGTLAHAFSPPNGMFHLDGDEDWVVSGDVSSSSLASAVDLESVAVHEIGHLLGLGHSSVEDAIMYPTLSSRTRKVALASDDIEGIQILYGSNPNYKGSSTTTAQERDTSGARHVGIRWGLSFLLAIAFILMIF